jgi:transcriptional regulatory protein LevR
MTQEQLQKTLSELRAELAHLSPRDEATRNHINGLIESLEQHLNEPANDANRNTLRDNFSSTIERFEAEHPRITLILNQIMNTLSGSGI